MVDIVDDTNKKIMNKYSEEFFAADVPHDEMVYKYLLTLDKKYDFPQIQ
jgi:hypothetical protein